MQNDVRRRAIRALCVLAAPFTFAAPAIAAPVPISSETATFCQDGYPINAAFDGDFSAGSGWAVYGQIGSSQTVAFKASSNVGSGDQTQLVFQLHMFWGASHILGKFRLSATTSGQSTYGQGATCSDPDPSGSANWTVLHPQSVHSQNGQTLTILGDGTVLASGNNPEGDLVTVVATTPLRGITGFRLEALADASFVDSGPGRADNGNFVLNELTVDASSFSPVPAAGIGILALMATLIAGAGACRLRRRPG
jgi:hypothetical protein